ncbi:MAG: hypothetical protein VKL42_11205 [Snowella sp.]|nr:hypothetical protein [Snowella sp.]
MGLLIALVLIGYYSITHNSLTSDEPAYLGAAYAYTQGVGLNPEHPLILKLLNSLLFWLKFPDIHVDLPNPHQLKGSAIRLVAFDAGYRLLMYFPKHFDSLVRSSRWLYFGVNSLLFIWLGLYSFGLKLLHPQIALTFATLWIFSPSFASHQGLITFDTAVAVTALMTILTTAITLYSVTQLQGKYLTWQFLILTVSLSLAINTKLSNLLLLAILIISFGGASVYLVKQKSPLIRSFITLSLGSLLVQPIIIIGMYRIAFAKETDQSLSAIGQRYLTTLTMTLEAARGQQVPFLWGAFQPVNYAEYISKIFWYKENPILFLLIGITLWALFLYGKKQKANNQGFQLKELIRSKLSRKTFLFLTAFSVLVSAYPLMYFGLAKGSHFVIGYRYFYPVLLFGYFLLTILLVSLKNYYSQKWLITGLLLYSLIGAIAIPQTLSYVNPLWWSDKWLLVNDSTLNWGQENQLIAQYLLQQKWLPTQNKNSLIYGTFGVVINVNQYLELLSKQGNYSLDIASYYQQPPFEPLKDIIAQLPHRYLLIDSTIKQILYAERHQSVIAAQNWQYLQEHRPIYTHNGIIFLYQLHQSS